MSVARPAWAPGPAKLALRGREIHVWRVGLDPAAHMVDALERTLSTDERERADRFHFARDRRRFIVARGTLRCLVGRYLDADPADVSFEYGDHGKPTLARAASPVFNVSHSEELALVAVAADGTLGVDVEAVRDVHDRDDIAARFFARRENASLQALPESLRTRAFFVCWTRKEAFVKALGDGLSRPLDSFDVTCRPDEGAELSIEGEPAESAKWMMIDLAPAPGYEGALVADGRDRPVIRWTWSEPDARVVNWTLGQIQEAV